MYELDADTLLICFLGFGLFLPLLFGDLLLLSTMRVLLMCVSGLSLPSGVTCTGLPNTSFFCFFCSDVSLSLSLALRFCDLSLFTSDAGLSLSFLQLFTDFLLVGSDAVLSFSFPILCCDLLLFSSDVGLSSSFSELFSDVLLFNCGVGLSWSFLLLFCDLVFSALM